MLSNTFLVDSENVSIKSLCGSEQLKEDDKIFIFVTEKTRMHNFHPSVISKINTKAQIKCISVATGDKNYLDFQLVTYLGLLVGKSKKKKDDSYYIISEDKGFLSSINLLLKLSNHHFELIPSVSYLYGKNGENIDSIYEMLFNVGLKTKTIKKILNIIYRSNNYEQAKKNIDIEFNYNKYVIDKFISVVKEYYKKR